MVAHTFPIYHQRLRDSADWPATAEQVHALDPIRIPLVAGMADARIPARRAPVVSGDNDLSWTDYKQISRLSHTPKSNFD